MTNKAVLDIDKLFTPEDFRNTSDRQRHNKTKCGKPKPVEVENIDAFAKFSSELMQKP